jgi:hypothetical protein
MLLQEHLTFDNAGVQILTEGDGPDKTMYMKGIFLQSSAKNHNGRIYPIEEIRKAVDDINKKLSQGLSVCGEADHPQELQIHLDRVSHKINEMWMDGPNGYGKLQLIPTPCGQIIRTLIESGVKLGVSSRGSGNVSDSGYVSEFEILTVDIVATPSAPAAFPVPVYEALMNRRNGHHIQDLAESVRHDKNAQKHLKKILLGWIDELNH